MTFMVFENHTLTHLQAKEMDWVTGKVSNVFVISAYPKTDRVDLAIELVSQDSSFSFAGDSAIIQQIEEAINDGPEVTIGYFPGIFPLSSLKDSFQGLTLFKNNECLYTFGQSKKHLSHNWMFGIGIVILLLGIYLFCLGRWYGGFW